MLWYLQLAWRNLWRNQRRSLLAVISVSLAVLLITFMQGFIGGVMRSVVSNYTRMETGHIRLTTPGFTAHERFMPVDEVLADPKAMEAALRSDPELDRSIEQVASRIRFGVLLTNDGLQKAAVGMAGDPVVEDKLLMLSQAIEPGGRNLSGPRELIMGAGLAKSLHHVLGDTVRLMSVGADGALHLRKLTLVGIFNTGVKAFDDRMFQVGLDDARALLRMGEGTQQLVVWLKDYEQTGVMAARIRALPAFKEVSVLPWTEIGEVYSLITMASSIYGFIFMLIALLGAIIIGNIMMMVILERRHEIGILRAMGFNRRETLMLFLLEGGMLGATGSAVGGGIGLLLTMWLHTHGVDFSDIATMQGFPMDSTIYFKVDPLAVVRAITLGTGVATLMSALPSWRATRLNIVDAIKAS